MKLASAVCVSTLLYDLAYELYLIQYSSIWIEYPSNMKGLSFHIFLPEGWKGHLHRDQKF